MRYKLQNLWTTITDTKDKAHLNTKIIKIQGKTHKKALLNALSWIKNSASRALPTRSYLTMLIPARASYDDELYRSKFRYNKPKEIIKIKEPLKYFVRGYGPEALKKIEGRK